MTVPFDALAEAGEEDAEHPATAEHPVQAPLDGEPAHEEEPPRPLTEEDATTALDVIAHDALPAAPARAAARHDPDAPDYARLRDVDFPVVWRGYDPQVVDAYVAEVTHALDLFEQRTEPTAAVQRALGRVGEQTASILQQAEQAADETTRSSRAAADDRLQRAEQESAALQEQAIAKVRALDDDVERLWQERQRLIDATKELADQLRAVAEDGESRFPPAAPQPPVADDPPPPDLD
ncbi:MAG TPA: DivIVA domain-containing protein [Conexibacter sp.]|nr:DivIVA domain-containing protein [Conexibacter sp.]